MDFIVRFLICNAFIAAIVGIILAVRHGLKGLLSARRIYQLWFLLLALLAVPFLPVDIPRFGQMLTWFTTAGTRPVSGASTAYEAAGTVPQGTSSDWLNDFSISVSRKAPDAAVMLLLVIWIGGMIAMLVMLAASFHRLNEIRRSSTALQNAHVLALYRSCLQEAGIGRNIPIRATAFLASPVITGFLKPCIYLPLHLISDDHPDDIRYMLLHELQHYRHKDALVNNLTNAAKVLYWFNPFVWIAFKEMQGDREAACDSAVLKMLGSADYEKYGHTLINYAEKISLAPFPLASGIGGNPRQLRRRVLNIASYRPESASKRILGLCIYCLAALALFGTAPALSTYASGKDYYDFNTKEAQISYPDLSSYFSGYDGTFVLYDTAADSWLIYDEENAALRVSPNSTYKVYAALLGLETGIISPGMTRMEWDGTLYPFDEWNQDQDLDSAMRSSVNWYFQTIDRQAGAGAVHAFLKQMRYGNEDNSGGADSYWMESSLKISAIEQVELLRHLYEYDLPADKSNIDAVKDALLLSQDGDTALYGKTGTGRVDGKDVNGSFIGWVELPGRTCLFAVNIRGDSEATGAAASRTAQSILSDMQLLD